MERTQSRYAERGSKSLLGRDRAALAKQLRQHTRCAGSYDVPGRRAHQAGRAGDGGQEVVRFPHALQNVLAEFGNKIGTRQGTDDLVATFGSRSVLFSKAQRIQIRQMSISPWRKAPPRSRIDRRTPFFRRTACSARIDDEPIQKRDDHLFLQAASRRFNSTVRVASLAARDFKTSRTIQLLGRDNPGQRSGRSRALLFTTRPLFARATRARRPHQECHITSRSQKSRHQSIPIAPAPITSIRKVSLLYKV